MSPQKCLNIEQRLIPKYFNRNVRTPGIKKKKKRIIYTPKGGRGGGDRTQRISNKNNSRLLNGYTEGLKITKQCLKNPKGYFHLCECRQTIKLK